MEYTSMDSKCGNGLIIVYTAPKYIYILHIFKG